MSTTEPPRPIVVIPVHLGNPSAAERISIEQCGYVFKRRTIAFLCPKSLDISFYKTIIPQAIVLRVDDTWMNSLISYNKMMISDTVINLCLDFSHLLIHEPDALVIADALDHWCRQDFDYIGAPWLKEAAGQPGYFSPFAVGNSGLSLFRISAVKSVLESEKRWYPNLKLVGDLASALLFDIRRTKRGLAALGSGGRISGAWKVHRKNCDIFWSFIVPALEPGFRIASVDQALLFSWETYPRHCYAITGGILPMGFHAWGKYDRDFLLDALREHEVQLSIALRNLINNKNTSEPSVHRPEPTPL